MKIYLLHQVSLDKQMKLHFGDFHPFQFEFRSFWKMKSAKVYNLSKFKLQQLTSPQRVLKLLKLKLTISRSRKTLIIIETSVPLSINQYEQKIEKNDLN